MEPAARDDTSVSAGSSRQSGSRSFAVSVDVSLGGPLTRNTRLWAPIEATCGEVSPNERQFVLVEPPKGVEPLTYALRVRCSTN